MRERIRPLLHHPLLTPIVTALEARAAKEPLPGTPEEIAAYHRRRPPDAAAPAVADRTWDDLDMDAVFGRIDRCVSPVGQQVLYDLLRRPVAEPERIAERDARIRRFQDEPRLGERIERALVPLRQRSAYDLPHLLFDELPRRPRFYLVFPALTLLSVVAIALAFVHPAAFIAVVALCLANVIVQAYYRPRVHHLIVPISALRMLHLAGRRLAELDDLVLRPYADELRARTERLRWINRLARHLVRETHGNDLAELAAGYANLLFLLDVNAFVFSIEGIRRHREDLRVLFETVGMLDAMRSAALFREALPCWCAPEPTGARKEVVAEGIVHPLLDDPVANDLRVRGKGLLITGSNMAGKTTFLRTVGLCALLARTIATCPARRWSAPPLGVASLIARKDDLLGGKSYFLVEAELVRGLLTLADGEEPQLFIVDEIFRGTNTRERIAASKAVLEHLNRGPHVCLVSTHDLELLELLGPDWEFWHFRETVEAGGVRFDYRIRPGASSVPNALRLLRASDYPPDVIRAAFRVYESLTAPASTGPGSGKEGRNKD